MITTFIFDLDGTLVQTEILKALSYAKAAVALCPETVTNADVMEAFKDVVGLSRDEVAQKLMARFDLEDAARRRMDEFNVQTPWEAYVAIRLRLYEAILDNPHILRAHLIPHNVDLLKWSRRRGYRTGLATMSHRDQVDRVLNILDLSSDFDFIATRENVAHGKPDPEIYTLVARELRAAPEDCLVIEDSSTGIKAALAAGMGCIVVTTDLTRESVYKSRLLDERWIVDNPAEVEITAKAFVDKRL